MVTPCGDFMATARDGRRGWKWLRMARSFTRKLLLIMGAAGRKVSAVCNTRDLSFLLLLSWPSFESSGCKSGEIEALVAG